MVTRFEKDMPIVLERSALVDVIKKAIMNGGLTPFADRNEQIKFKIECTGNDFSYNLANFIFFRRRSDGETYTFPSEALMKDWYYFNGVPSGHPEQADCVNAVYGVDDGVYMP